jgi:hypothetical protein
LLGVSILLAGASTASMQLLDATSSKPLDEFGACFTRLAEHGNRAWAYLPGERGGTFTDSGVGGAPASYWLRIRDDGRATRLRLFAEAPSVAAAIDKAVDQCR